MGVILIPPHPNGQFYVFHFASVDNPGDTFDGILRPAFFRANLRGYRAVINGGELISGQETEVGDAMQGVRYGLDSRGIPIIGYVPGPNAHVDRNGRIYWTAPEPGINWRY